MPRFVLTAGLLITLSGCVGGERVAVYAPGPGVSVANLALGPSRDHTFLAETYAYRSSWPSARLGYLFDDVSTYTEVIYDDQSYYSWRGGGSFAREAVSVRSGVLFR
jgi:hypothetical protein